MPLLNDVAPEATRHLNSSHKGNPMKSSRARIVLSLAAILTTVIMSQAQTPQLQQALSEGVPEYRVPSDQELQLLKKDLRSKRKQIIAANMNLTEQEAEKFWPVYDQYTAELSKINDQKLTLIEEYILTYNANSISDEQAESYVKRWAAIDEATNQLRTKYFPIFHRVLSGKSTALFFQMDHRLALMIDIQLTSQMPILER